MGELGSGSWSPDLLYLRIRKHALSALLDGLLGTAAFCLAFVGQLGGHALVLYLSQAAPLLLFVAFAYVGANYLRLVYSRLWRYATFRDLAALGEAVVLATLASAAAHHLLHISPRPATSQIALQGFIAFFLMLFVRSSYVLERPRRAVQSLASNRGADRSRALIVGANNDGFRLAQHLLNDPGQSKGYHAVGFVDIDEGKTGSTICGLKVMGTACDIP